MHIKDKILKDWNNLDLSEIFKLSRNIHKVLLLPLTEDILWNKKDKTKLKSNRNNIIGTIPEKEKDRALGFLLKQPSLMTRLYNGFIKTIPEQKCPYCD